MSLTKEAYGAPAKYDADNKFFLYQLTHQDLKQDNTPMVMLQDQTENIFFEHVPN